MSETDNLHPEYDMKSWLRCCEAEIKKPLEGKTTGVIPPWLQGTLIRNGPGSFKCGSHQFDHIFDGPALLHRFALNNGQVTYQCRFLNTDTLRKNKRAKRIVVTEFATKSVPDPCHTIFDRIASVFNPINTITDNAAVSVHPFGDEVYAMTEVTNIYKIDPETLETLDKENLFNSLIVCHTAHPHVMPNGDVYNVGLQISKGMKHVIVKFPFNEKGNMFELAEVINTIEPRWRFNPAYMHSFGITENYFVIIEQPLSISLFSLMKGHILNQPFSNSLSWYPEYETHIILVHRETGTEIRYRTDTIFFMHTINCFEFDGKLVVDLCSYNDAKIIDAMYVEAIKNLNSNPHYGQWCQTRPKRIVIPLDAPPFTKVEVKLIADIGIEAPRINYEAYNGRPYRYFYGIGAQVHSEQAGSIMKVDTHTGEVKSWREYGAYPGEPVFVARPDGKHEDDGVLLSALVWHQNDHSITLLVLDAKDLKELGRTHFTTPSQAPHGFHGWYFPDQKIYEN